MSETPLSTAAPAPVAYLRAHRYPAWLVAVAVALLVAVVYSLVLLPRFYSAARLLGEAEDADAGNRIDESVSLLGKALVLEPDSEDIREQFAYESFKLPSQEAHENAMRALIGLTLDKDELAKLVTVMPPEYRNSFHPAEAK